ncbi:protein mab-21-like 3 [Hemitrygon akajei]|uniref:protein mab-21-like 3 n=1 Tax=Hemitrygon akajei TaxID=2704970 RepID=UPI003BF9934F
MDLNVFARTERLEGPLQEYYRTNVKKESGKREVKNTLQSTIKDLLEFIHGRDKLFANNFIQVGSIADRTKAEALNELDVLVPLQKDKFRVAAIDEHLDAFEVDEYVGGSWRCLSHDETIMRLFNLVKEYKDIYYKDNHRFQVRKKKITASALPLMINWIDVDMVLCIENALSFSDVKWLYPSWFNGRSRWLSYEQQERVKSFGIDLTCQGIHWRPSFSRIDAFLFGEVDGKGGYRKKAFKIFKSLNNYYWTVDQLCEGYKGKPKPFLNSFFTKFLYLHTREKYPEPHHWDSLAKSFCNFLDVLNDCCNQKCLYHYYQANVNLFERVADKTFKWLQEKIHNILEDPENEIE